jgi:transposase
VNYCGIDLAGVSSYGYVTDEKGRKLWSGQLATEQGALRRLVKRFGREGLSIAIEAGNQTAWVYELLVQSGAKVTVVHPTKVKLIAESRRKTDKIDAKVLCELLRLDALPQAVHMPGPDARALRGLLVARRQLVSARSKLRNVVRGMLRQTGVRLPARALSTLAGWRHVFHAGFQHDHIAYIVVAYYESFCGVDRIDPRAGSATCRAGEEGTTRRAAENDAQGGPHRRPDLPGRGR